MTYIDYCNFIKSETFVDIVVVVVIIICQCVSVSVSEIKITITQTKSNMIGKERDSGKESNY